MSFFQDLKDDLSEAVNELMINENEEEELKEEVFEDPADDDSVIEEETEEAGDAQTDDLLAEADLLFSPEEIAALAGEAPVEDVMDAPVEEGPAEVEALNETVTEDAADVVPEVVDIIAKPVGSDAPAQETPDSVMKETSLLGDIDLNSMLESIQSELNAQKDSIQKDSIQNDSMEAGAPEEDAEAMNEEPVKEAAGEAVREPEEELSAVVENSVKEEAEGNEEGTDEDNIEGQMSLEEMFSGIPAVLPEADKADVKPDVIFAEETAAAPATDAETLADPAGDIDVAMEAAEAVNAEPVLSEEATVSETDSEAVAAVEATAVETSESEATAAVDAAAVKPAAAEPSATEAAVAEPAAEVPVVEETKAPEVKEDKKPARKSTRRKKASATGSASAAAAKAAMNVPDDRVLSDETAQLLAGVKITGNIISDGNLELGGEVEGDIDILGKISVSGTVCGNIKAGEIYAEGAEINGAITCEGSVKIGQGAVIIGDINGSSAVIAGAVKGNIDVKGPVILADTAIVMGDIRSASVQISNGAAIEGMCSQVYAEVNPGTFFADFDKAKK